MIYKLRLVFDYPLALQEVSRWSKLRLVMVHHLLAVGFFLHPYTLAATALLASFLLVFESIKAEPYTADNIRFGWQRIILAMAVNFAFMGLQASGAAEVSHWWWVSLVGITVSLYDGYLVWHGITGIFYINIKRKKAYVGTTD